MLLYYQSWIFYNHQLMFFSMFFTSQKNQYQTVSKCHETLRRFFMDQKTPNGPRQRLGAPWWVVPTSGAPRTASSLYKYPNIPETLGESTKINSRRCKFQNHQIQSRHHHGGVHHVHWCFSGPLDVLWSKKSTKSFAAFGLHLVLISCDIKTCKKQQLALGTMSIG